MEELKLTVQEGTFGTQVHYALRCPGTAAGTSPFDRFWRQQTESLRRQTAQERGNYPTGITSEWQLTRRDSRFCSGFLEISRRVGYGDWTLRRISATFPAGTGGAVTLRRLLGENWYALLLPRALSAMEPVSRGETPFYRGWQRRLGVLLHAGRYYLTDEGLCLWFPQEQLAPRNAGLPTVLLPYESADFLKSFSAAD